MDTHLELWMNKEDIYLFNSEMVIEFVTWSYKKDARLSVFVIEKGKIG